MDGQAKIATLRFGLNPSRWQLLGLDPCLRRGWRWPMASSIEVR